MGLLFKSKKIYDKAIGRFEKALELNPCHKAAMAKLREAIKSHEEAEKDLLLSLGDIYEQKGQYGEASRKYAKVLEKNPFDWDIYEAVRRTLPGSLFTFVSDRLPLPIIKEVSETFQPPITILAITLGGVWTYLLFVRKRQKYPRANIAHAMTVIDIGANKLLLHLTATISNTGDVLLTLVSAETRIQKVVPVMHDILESIGRGEDPVPAEESEVNWPLIAQRKSNWKKGEFEMEPGEIDRLEYDFILEAEVKTIEAYSYFTNAVKRKHKREIGWAVTTVYNIPASHTDVTNRRN